jgi:hypothetical protein
MNFHHWTTPLPNPLSSRFHALPLWFHKVECALTLLVEGPLSILQLLPWQSCRTASFLLDTGLMLGINASGNYGHLGWLSVTQFLSLLDDRALLSMAGMGIGQGDWLRRLLLRTTLWPSILPVVAAPAPLLYYFSLAAGMSLMSMYLVLALVPFYSTCESFIGLPHWLSPHWHGILEKPYYRAARFHLIGRYVKFAGMTTFRHELVLQVSATAAAPPTLQAPREAAVGISPPGSPRLRFRTAHSASSDGGFVDWPFLYKPTSVSRTPPLLPPGHMAGVDWQCWFLPLALARSSSASSFFGHARAAALSSGLPPYGIGIAQPDWLQRLQRSLLAGDPDVLALMGQCPLPRGTPPRSIRIAVYDYCFAWEKTHPRPWTVRDLQEYGSSATEEVGAVWWRRPIGHWGEPFTSAAPGASLNASALA